MSTSTVEELSAQNQSRMAAILESCLFALEHGESLEPDALLAQNPDLAEPLGKCLTTLMSLHAAVHGDETLPANELPEVGGRLGEFVIEELIGRGGMGSVYRASQPSLGRQVALKLLANNRLLAPTQLKRFQLEARAVAQLHHPNIVPVYSVGQEGDIHYYAMQLIEGQSLEKVGPEVWNQPGYRHLLDCAIDLCDALNHTHAVGIIHRDVKPSNLLLDNQGKIWITDFGLAQSRHDTRLTVTGDLVGTMNYMSPEQALGKPIDERTDVYSLGVTLYEMLTGKQAFPGQVRAVVLRTIEEHEPIAPRKQNPSLPYDLETVLLKAMSKDREQRYSSAQDMAADLMRVRDGQPIFGKRPTWFQISSRWIKRHRLPVGIAAAGLATTSLAVVVGAASVLLTREELVSTRQQSQDHLKAAEQNYWQGRNLVEHWNRDIISQLADIPGADRLRAQMLADTVEYYRAYIQDRLESSPNDPRLTADLAEARRGLASALDQAGQLPAASDAYQQVLDGLLAQPGSDPLSIATIENDLAVVLLRDNQFKDSLAHLQSAQQRLASLGTSPADQSVIGLRAAVLVNLARAHQLVGDAVPEAQALDEAERLYRQLASAEENARNTSANWRHYQSELGTVLDQRALVLAPTDIEAALKLSGEAVALHQQSSQSATQESVSWPSVNWLSRLAASQHNQAVLRLQAGQVDLAEETLLQAIATKRQLIQMQGPRANLNFDLARSYNALGQLARRKTDWELAAEAFSQARKSLMAASTVDQNGENQWLLAETLVNLWEVQNNLGDNSNTEIRTQLETLIQHFLNSPLNSDAQATITKLQRRIAKLQAGRAQPSELTKDGSSVDSVGTPTEAGQ